MDQLLSITALARHTGVSSKSLRHWEALGLLPKASRSHTGYRFFPSEAIAYVGFVKKSKAMGLTLKQMQGVLRLARKGIGPCPTVEFWVDQRIAALEAEIQSLTGRLADLKRIRQNYSRGRRAVTGSRKCCSLLIGLPEEKHFRRADARQLSGRVRSAYTQ